MLQASEDRLKVACDALIKHFSITQEIVAETKTVLMKVRTYFGGDGPSIYHPKQTLAYLWAVKYDKTQLNNIDFALMRLDVLDATNISRLEALNIVIELLNKSRSQNWSSGTKVGNTYIIDPSLNNRLTCELLAMAGFSEPMHELLQAQGPRMCDLLQEALNKEKERERDATRSSENSLELEKSIMLKATGEEGQTSGRNSAWNDGTEAPPVTQEALLRLRKGQPPNGVVTRMGMN